MLSSVFFVFIVTVDVITKAPPPKPRTAVLSSTKRHANDRRAAARRTCTPATNRYVHSVNTALHVTTNRTISRFSYQCRRQINNIDVLLNETRQTFRLLSLTRQTDRQLAYSTTVGLIFSDSIRKRLQDAYRVYIPMFVNADCGQINA